jgi:arylsulfatase A
MWIRLVATAAVAVAAGCNAGAPTGSQKPSTPVAETPPPAPARPPGPRGMLTRPGPPNIIIITGDDLGYGDLSSYGAAMIRTPNIDRMGAEGVKLTSFITNSPVCSPSRGALLTGRYPTRIGVPGVIGPKNTDGLRANETTLAEALKPHGYATALIGKWHVGHTEQLVPTKQGFDYFFGLPYSNDMHPLPLMRNLVQLEEPADQATLTERYTEEAVRYIQENKDRPFFLYLPHTAPHVPLAISDRFRGKSAGGLYGDVVEAMDWSVGEVMRTLYETGLDQATIVIFSSDNGPYGQGSAGILSGRKYSTYEGGVRVPFFIRWPGQLPAGRVSSEMVSSMDLFPTLLRAAGLPLPPNGFPLDGEDVWPLLRGDVQQLSPRLTLYFNGYFMEAARLGKWKIHVRLWDQPLAKPKLFDLEVDPGERNDVAASHQTLVADLKQQIAAAIKTFPSRTQEMNP